MSSEEQILDQQGYEDDFWPGFVDILSGLILIFAFMVLVAGIIIALIFQIDPTVRETPRIFRNILTVVQQSPLTISARFDVIERAKAGNEVQLLVDETRNQLEVIGRRTHQVLENYPILERKLVQEIRFLQREINLVKESPPQRGTTQKVRDFQGGRLADTGSDRIPPTEKKLGKLVTGWG